MDTVSSVGAQQARVRHQPDRHRPREILRTPTKATVLVVDDNPATRSFVRETLSLEGMHVVEADGGAAAIDTCRSDVPDLVLIDLCLSDMRGTEVVQRLRSEARTAALPIIVFTGAPEEAAAHGVASGFTDLLAKPVDADALVQAVRSHLGPAPTAPTRSGARPRVLLVDAEPARSVRVRLHLRRLGFDVMVVATASQALRSAGTFSPDLVVADLVLPDTTALDLTRSLRAHERLAQVPVVLTSPAPWSEVQRRLAERAGATAYVTLTADLGHLRDAVLGAASCSSGAPCLSDPVTAETRAETDADDEAHAEHLLKELHEQYRRQVSGDRTRARGQAELAVLQGLADALSDTADLDGVLRDALARCLHAIGASRGAVFVSEIDGGFSMRAHLGDLGRLPGARIPASEELFHRVTATGETIVVDTETGRPSAPDGASTHASTIVAPLAAGSDSFGVLVVEVPAHEELRYWLHFLKLVGIALGFAVASARHPRPGRTDTPTDTSPATGRDHLTGLADAGAFEEALAELVARPDAHGAVVVIDLDRIRHVNDALGHHTGDELLQGVGRALEAVAGDGAVLARLHSDVFAVLDAEVSDPAGGADLANRLMTAFDSPIRCNGYTLYTTASVGVAVFPHHARRPGALIQHATTALDQAKERGGNTVEVYSDRRGNTLWQRLTVDQGLRAALEREQFLVHYQPIVDLGSGAVVSAEALLRWDRPLHGVIEAANFIEVAEATGLIIPIGAWVLHHVARQARHWTDDDLAIERIAVNVGAREFHEGHIYDAVVQAIEDTGVDPSVLTLEITERVALADLDRAVETLQALRDLGVQTSLDDFGTGYSSLRYVQELPIDSMKIDRSFVASAAADRKNEPILATIVDLAHRLGMTVVAEGIETEACLDLVRSLGCDLAQGYHLGRPAPADEMAELFPAVSG
ncbi:MAG: EAL domain-containing protein [Actinobacteria bacterium]|nr:EAL domain-containing protein [Actinomycetota bacterium]